MPHSQSPPVSPAGPTIARSGAAAAEEMCDSRVLFWAEAIMLARLRVSERCARSNRPQIGFRVAQFRSRVIPRWW